jgi:hypothetical protein
LRRRLGDQAHDATANVASWDPASTLGTSIRHTRRGAGPGTGHEQGTRTGAGHGQRRDCTQIVEIAGTGRVIMPWLARSITGKRCRRR